MNKTITVTGAHVLTEVSMETVIYAEGEEKEAALKTAMGKRESD